LGQEELKRLVEYDPDTGLFLSLRRYKIIGTENEHGYTRIKLNGISYYAHKLAWFYIYGIWVQVDHINRIYSDNRLVNLRPITAKQNAANQGVRITNMLGVKGVQKRGNKYRAYITNDYKTYYLGTYDTLEEAKVAYQTKAKELFGEYFGE
jgi:hypothetical protein